ncbi:hypothetical protein [Glaciimonas immobilis]|uniref:Uncharacterized protein n=1 Tax=Glaciimonas immobilis TaxID=728004 RepID=A0A840RR53_9BURK|nr:hypothetical protein [Glaciimonas immobilis]KAF3999785.1 hypothetical protein HAV38_00920 [Glaciimonas immobilis]MBB5200255.1 hypothetical protein [Glaciimonas immobilis]
MKKLFGVAALIFAFSPLANAQGLSDHPDARNDRPMEAQRTTEMRQHHATPKRMKHHRRMEHKK